MVWTQLYEVNKILVDTLDQALDLAIFFRACGQPCKIVRRPQDKWVSAVYAKNLNTEMTQYE